MQAQPAAGHSGSVDREATYVFRYGQQLQTADIYCGIPQRSVQAVNHRLPIAATCVWSYIMWDLWWIKWQWDRLSPEYFVFLHQLLHIHQLHCFDTDSFARWQDLPVAMLAKLNGEWKTVNICNPLLWSVCYIYNSWTSGLQGCDYKSHYFLA